MALLAAADFGESYFEELAALVILAFVFYRYAWPRLRKLMRNRQQKIAAQLSAGDEARAEAQRLVEERRAALEAARSDAVRLVEQARAAAARITAEGERRAVEEHQRLVAKAASDIELERGRLRDEVVAELNGLVIDGAGQVVEAELTAARQHRLIAEAISAAESEVA